MSNVVNFDKVSLTRAGNSILNNTDWRVDADQRWVILGPNGAGKTSLLRIAAAQLQPTSGAATVLGELLGEANVFELRTRIGFASTALTNQIPNTESVLDTVMTASYGVTGRWRETYDSVDERRALRVLSEWRLAGYESRSFGTLSDGERKRVQIARAVMTDPELLLLDEPVASLDLGQRETTLDLLTGFARSDFAPAMVMVTHHIEEIPQGFTHAMLMRSGESVMQGRIDDVITSGNVSDLFGVSVTINKLGDRFAVSR
jgi:iron complex transport system ATP-binding protein